jgi:hypothetical protein
MRWKISHHEHDPRRLDLVAVLAFVVIVIAASTYFASGSRQTTTADFIVPSQNVRW